MIKTRSFMAGVAVLVIATLGVGFFWQNAADKKNVLENDGNKSGSIAAYRADGSAQAESSSEQSVKPQFSMETSSLRGTEVDGGIMLDANGKVVPDMGMRRLFDYYLSLVGERDIVQIRVLVKDRLSSQYKPADTDLVLHYFDRYTDYLAALSELNIGALAKPEERLAKVTALRKKMLGKEMVLAFFTDEEALATLTLKRMAIANDKNLGAEEKGRLLAELDASENYSARTEADTAAMVTEQTRQLDAMQLTEAERAAEREALWGKEAAGRLAQLDHQRDQWDARIDKYLLERSRIDANRSLSATARAQAIAALRAQQFNAAEQRRIASLEAIGQLKPGG